MYVHNNHWHRVTAHLQLNILLLLLLLLNQEIDIKHLEASDQTKFRIRNITAKAAFEIWKWMLGTEEKTWTAQMKFLRHLLGITKLYKENNQCIREKTGAQNTVKEIKQYQEKWLQHVQRMDTNRLPKQALQYQLKEEGT